MVPCPEQWTPEHFFEHPEDAVRLCAPPPKKTETNLQFKASTMLDSILSFCGIHGRGQEMLFEFALGRDSERCVKRRNHVQVWNFFWKVRDPKRAGESARFLDDTWKASVKRIMSEFTLRRRKQDLPALRNVVPPMKTHEIGVRLSWPEAQSHSRACLVMSDHERDFDELTRSKKASVEDRGKALARVIRAMTTAKRTLMGMDFADRSAVAFDPKGQRPSVDNEHWKLQEFKHHGQPKTRSDVLMAANEDETLVEETAERLEWVCLQPGPLFVPSTKLLVASNLIEQ